MGGEQRYLVTIQYREPTYQRHKHDNVCRLHPYRASYEVITTEGEEQARQLAVREFHRMAVHSSSGWVRQIVKVDCAALGDDVTCKVMGEA